MTRQEYNLQKSREDFNHWLEWFETYRQVETQIMAKPRLLKPMGADEDVHFKDHPSYNSGVLREEAI